MNNMKMSKEKYVFLIVLTTISFVYILVTEVVDRFSQTAQSYNELQGKKGELLTPDELRTKKSSLVAENEKLTTILTKDMSSFSKNHMGVFEYLNSNAKENGIIFGSLIPKEAVNNGQLKELAFKVDFDADYHQLGKFVNAIETGPMPVSIIKMDIATDPEKASKVHVSAEGKAYMISNSNHEN